MGSWNNKNISQPWFDTGCRLGDRLTSVTQAQYITKIGFKIKNEIEGQGQSSPKYWDAFQIGIL